MRLFVALALLALLAPLAPLVLLAPLVFPERSWACGASLPVALVELVELVELAEQEQ